MPYGVANPYGAVPSALKELRLSFTDILNNIIQGKEIERQAARDLATAELAKAKIGAETERFGIEMAGKERVLDLDSLRQGREFGLRQEQLAGEERGRTQRAVEAAKMFGLKEEEVGLQKRRADFEEKKYKETELPESQQRVETNKKLLEKYGLDIQKTGLEMKKLRQETAEDTIENLAKRANIPQHVFEFLVPEGSRKNVTSGAEFAKWIDRNKEAFNSQDISGALEQHNIVNKIESINATLATLPPTDSNRAVLMTEKAKLGKRHEDIDQLRQVLRAKPEQIAIAAGKEYKDNFALQEEWKNKGGQEAYVQSVYNTVKKMKASDDKIAELLKNNPVPGGKNEEKPTGEAPINKTQATSETGLTPEGRAFIDLYKQQLKAIREEADKGIVPPSQKSETKALDRATAAKILQEAGGDKEKARNLAVKRGYTF